MIQGRFQRIKAVLQKRQTDLTVCLEHVHKPQNVSAILRSCDAVGIHEANIVWNQDTYFRRGTAMGTQRWLKHRKHSSIESAHQHFKQHNMQLLVTNLSDKSVDFREVDYTQPTAILLGQEKYGASEEAIALADHEIVIPMMGMVQSLNVSVAAGLILYEAQHQRQQAGLYNKVSISDEDLNALLFEGCHPKLFAQCQAKNLAIPQLDENGEVQASDDWWRQMQLSSKVIADNCDDDNGPGPSDNLYSNL